ncbi:MAG: glycoside hydrolase family 95 protein, partial [Oscillospiraceae bacterium]|nr:glycoside hydrolase family 95 protein [Oscillospiraceae bacterium]
MDNQKMDMQTTLWYKQPAGDFDHAIPVGNGRIGGMVYGGAASEKISLNEDSVWSGGKRERNNPEGFDGFKEVRSLLMEERIPVAEKTAFEKMQGVIPECRHYMPLGEIQIDMELGGKAKEYIRSLDLKTAVASVKFTSNGIAYERHVFVSAPDNVMVIHIKSGEPGMVSIKAGIDGRMGYYDDCRPCRENAIMYTGGTGGKNGINFAAVLGAVSEGGNVYTRGGKLIAENADSVTLILSAATSFYFDDNYEDAALLDAEYALESSYDELVYRHIEDYSELFGRTVIDLEDNSDGGSALPTDERL